MSRGGGIERTDAGEVLSIHYLGLIFAKVAL
jgi:hypothetical protein